MVISVGPISCPLPPNAGSRQRGSATFCRAALAHDAEVVRRAGGFQLNAAFLGAIVKPIQNFLVFLGRHHLLFGNAHAAAHRNQQEGVQGVGAKLARHFQHGGKLVGVVARDGHVDLHRHAQLFQISQAAQGLIKCSRDASKGIVGSGVRSVQTDGDAAHAGIHDLVGYFLGHQRSIGRQGYAQPAIAPIAGQFKNVASKKRFATA